jgi:fructokinase
VIETLLKQVVFEHNSLETNFMNSPVQIIGLGELLWDCFPDRRLPGGAPANVAYHAQQLGLSAAVVTRVGQDNLGEELIAFLRSRGLSTEFVQIDPKHQTGTVMVWPEPKGSVGYTFLENSAWDFLEAKQELIDAIRTARVICFGTLGQRRPAARSTIHQCLNSAPKDCMIVYDLNLRPPFFARDWILKSLKHATVVKLNQEEVKVLAKMLEISADDEVRFAKTLLDTFKQIDHVYVTRGSEGCLGVTCDEVIELSGIPTEVRDTVGAGDAFTAGIIFGQLASWPLGKTLDLANHFGALVASRNGAMPSLTSELNSLKSNLDWSFRDTRIP